MKYHKLAAMFISVVLIQSSACNGRKPLSVDDKNGTADNSLITPIINDNNAAPNQDKAVFPIKNAEDFEGIGKRIYSSKYLKNKKWRWSVMGFTNDAGNGYVRYREVDRDGGGFYVSDLDDFVHARDIKLLLAPLPKDTTVFFYCRDESWDFYACPPTKGVTSLRRLSKEEFAEVMKIIEPLGLKGIALSTLTDLPSETYLVWGICAYRVRDTQEAGYCLKHLDIRFGAKEEITYAAGIPVGSIEQLRPLLARLPKRTWVEIWVKDKDSQGYITWDSIQSQALSQEEYAALLQIGQDLGLKMVSVFHTTEGLGWSLDSSASGSEDAAIVPPENVIPEKNEGERGK